MCYVLWAMGYGLWAMGYGLCAMLCFAGQARWAAAHDALGEDGMGHELRTALCCSAEYADRVAAGPIT